MKKRGLPHDTGYLQLAIIFLLASLRCFRIHWRVFLVRLIEQQQGIHMRQEAPQIVG